MNFRVGWRDVDRTIIYVQFIRGCTALSVVNACKQWRALSNSVDYETSAIINVVDVSFGRTLGQLNQYEGIGDIIPPGSQVIAIVGAQKGAALLIQSLLYTLFPAAQEYVFFFDTVEDAETFLRSL